jgi:hypothetical protein
MSKRIDALAEKALFLKRFQLDAAIAQLVEHVIRNDGVTGSNPVCGTSSFKASQRRRLPEEPDG